MREAERGREAAYLSRLRRELRAIRRSSQLSQEGLAMQLNERLRTHYDGQAVNAWEWGPNRPPVMVWLGYLKIAADVGLDPVVLMNRVLGRASTSAITWPDTEPTPNWNPEERPGPGRRPGPRTAVR